MRLLRVLAALAVLLTACTDNASPKQSPGPSARTATPAPAVVLSKLPIAATLGQQGIRVSPNGEMVLVVEREGFVHTIYDLSGRTLATAKLGEVAMNPFWLPDSSGVVTGRRVEFGPTRVPVLDLAVLDTTGSLRELVRGVSYPTGEWLHASADRSSLAFATPCCPSTIVTVPLAGGAAREIARGDAQLRVLSWDADGHVLYWSGADAIAAARADGSRYEIPLGLPSGVNALDVSVGVRTVDASANVLRIQANAAFPGSADNNTASRTLIARELRPYPASTTLPMRVTPNELLTYALGTFGAYDITTGETRTLATIANDACCPRPTAMSGRIVLDSPGRTWVRLFDVDRDDRWHEAEVGTVLQTVGYALSRGRFLVFDLDGAPYALDGVAARAGPARPTTTSKDPNAVAGTVQSARNGIVGKKMDLAWRMPDGAPQSLDYYAGSLVVVSFWTRACVMCTQQLGLIADVAVGRRLEIIAVGVDETEASALEVAKDHRRLRPLVGTRASLKDIGVDVLPQTFILDSDHVVREVIVGPLSWDGLMRALTAASKSRLALRDRDVALS